MSLNEIKIKPFFNSQNDDVIEEFYIPALSNAKCYKRVSAYFDSNILSLYSKGIENIIKEKGHIYFVFSCEINENDFELIKKAYSDKMQIFNRLNDRISDEYPSDELKNLAYLIKYGFVDIKIAFTKTGGIFHDKFGLIEDESNSIYFRGSNNETIASVSCNYESFETTCSWNASNSENKKIQNAQENFNKLWNNNASDDLYVIDIPEIVKEKIVSYSKDRLILNYENKENTFILDFIDKKIIGINNLKGINYLSPEYSFFKRELQHLVQSISGSKYYFSKLNYLHIKKLIAIIKEYADKYSFNVYITQSLNKFIYQWDIILDKRRLLGISIKNKDSILQKDFENFRNIVNSEMVRSLREPQLWDAFHMSYMMRSANFSVPGAGKTSIVYGAYAYLSSKKINQVKKIVMIGPINSFGSWKREFDKCFGHKKKLKVFDYQKEREVTSQNRFFQIAFHEKEINLFLFNYESLQNNIDALKHIVDSETLLVFDEVHRIKSIDGKRATSALKICDNARFRVVLTGTPIPNGYVDLYNMLNLLFTDEYESFFGFDKSFLKLANNYEINQNAINQSIYPFFCRTNKADLNVPPADLDNLDAGYCITNTRESELFEIIYRAFHKNTLLLYIRLIQASNNPSLLLNSIKKEDEILFNTFDYSPDFIEDSFEEISELTSEDIEYIKSFDMTTKFYKGIDLVSQLVKQGLVIVWGIFVDTLYKIRAELLNRGIKARVINGSVPISERENIINDFLDNKFDVLITNPHTLAESVSLHTSCHQAVYFEYSFNLVHMLQSRDRIHRLGLAEDARTSYYYLILDNPYSLYTPIDKKIYQRLLEKEDIQNKALNAERVTFVFDDVKADVISLLGDFYGK